MKQTSNNIKAAIGSQLVTEVPRELRLCSLNREQCLILLEGEAMTNDSVARDRAGGFFWAFVIAIGGLFVACGFRLPDQSWNWRLILVLFAYSVGLCVSFLQWSNAKCRMRMTSARKSYSDVLDHVTRYFQL